MSYARSRLWLGITGVGSLVLIGFFALIFDLPGQLLAREATFGFGQFFQLACVSGLFMLWLLPLDFLGGYLLPTKFKKSDQKFVCWLRGYCVAAFSQALFFLIFGSLIIAIGQAYGLVGAMTAISLGIFGCFTTRNRAVLSRELQSEISSNKLIDAINLIQSWKTFVPRTVFVDHGDNGFTGGIVGLGKHAQIVIPKAWFSFSQAQLATAIARRAVAINSGSYSRGLALAFAWNVGGFMTCSLIPGAGLTSVAGLVTTTCGFTLWSFLGLLTLPTLSRNASLEIDDQLLKQGVPAKLISDTAFVMDQLQDGEPDRSRWIETIFHPVPNVSSHSRAPAVRSFAAWNVARTTLFFSWPCLGFLSRAVHCNVGRPELWTMLPTD